MQIINLYKYTRLDGGITVTPTKPEETTYADGGLRLIADKDKLLTTDGENLFSCIDVMTLDNWYEIKKDLENEEIKEGEEDES